MDFAELLKACELEVRSGRAQFVAETVSNLELAKIPREFRLKFANLCRRANLLSLGLKILGPIARSETETASPAEIAEYAVLLQRTGAVREALRLLQSTDSREVHEIHLFQAFCHFNLWEYAAAIAPLRKYLECPISPYARLVGQVNLAASWVAAQQWEQAIELLEENLELSRRLKAERLEGNSLELMAQVHVWQGQWDKAKARLEQAAGKFKGENTLDHLFVRKWQAICDALEGGSNAKLMVFRQEALRFGDWETVREVDYFGLKVDFAQERFRHLLFGTPFPEYRRRIQTEFPQNVGSFKYAFGRGGPRTAFLDLTNGESSLPVALSSGQKTHQLLAVLLRDFYRPVKFGDLFAQLYPDEFYNPFTSPGRVNQLILRGRRWIEEAGIPAEISSTNGTFSIRLKDPFLFYIGLQMPAPAEFDKNECLYRKALETFPDRRIFSAAAACRNLDLSSSSFKRFARWALSQGRLERFGAGAGTSYRLKTMHLGPNL
jgi:tetratricopeptide (TPR) repeat protein